MKKKHFNYFSKIIFNYVHTRFKLQTKKQTEIIFIHVLAFLLWTACGSMRCPEDELEILCWALQCGGGPEAVTVGSLCRTDWLTVRLSVPSGLSLWSSSSSRQAAPQTHSPKTRWGLLHLKPTVHNVASTNTHSQRSTSCRNKNKEENTRPKLNIGLNTDKKCKCVPEVAHKT